MTSIIASDEKGPAEKGNFQIIHRPSLLSRLNDLWARPWFAYLTILALQLRVMWNIWQYHDLTPGDTSRYFAFAWEWYANQKTHLTLSPLYSIFYGSFLWLTRDAHSNTILHRITIVLLGTFLVLAIMRRIFPAWLAWLIAMWWTILPVNFDAKYEVHQFALLPILIAWLIALRPNAGSWTRGFVLAIFLTSVILVRNEILIAAACFALFCLIAELQNKREQPEWNPVSTLLAYLLPLILLGSIVALICMRSDEPFANMRAEMQNRMALNMVQSYAFGYRQRHPDWQHDPWTDGPMLSQTDFGTPLPSPWQMLWRNPRALGQHMLWNMRLIPSGLQLLLFNAASGDFNPDYSPVRVQSPAAMRKSITVISIVLVAIAIALLQRSKWRAWFGQNQLGWETILSAVAMAPLIILTQRPRPEYLFSLELFMMAVIGTAIWIIVSHAPALKWTGLLMTATMIGSFFITSSAYKPNRLDQTAVWHTYERLRPFESELADPNAVFAGTPCPIDYVYYVGHHHGEYQTLTDAQLYSDWQRNESLQSLLDRKGATLFYLDEKKAMELDADHADVLQQAAQMDGRDGWKQLAREESDAGQWILLQKTNPKMWNILRSPLFDPQPDGKIGG